ncbi:insulin-like growth factor-binding protein 2 isoform X1 [Antechinus flavipes]|uniref:insulin-like growth factor-binding protein 2 isoform X1 n=1 Tax=Antechinus flavipes TaxID=38775 RepID=UPI0022354F4B|nr:insulin-like growth factor-binding protein 2 isoform X1 [Antechinus flavipes]
MLPRLSGPALLLLLPLLPSLLAGGGSHGALAEVLFRCPPCTPERLAACAPPAAGPAAQPAVPPAAASAAAAAVLPCTELVREPGCGCCPVCARLEGEACGVYTPRCAQGLRCYPNPGSELPLQALVQGEGTCAKRRDTEYGTSQEQVADTIDDSDGGLAENHVDGTVSVLGGGGRKPHKSGMKELAVIREKVIGQHRQLGKVNMHHHIHEDTKKLRPPPARTPCQQELDQVLERISTMRLPDERGPLEHLYSLHIPNCDKQGLYNLKQCKMSLNGQRGECWCVNPHTGKLIQGAPTIRGDPECHLFYTEQEARGAHAQRMQ